jgi:hypothetical protein
MAQTIKLKRGTTTPTTSNIVSGEVAVDTSAQKLYINDGGTVKEIAGNGVFPSISDSGTASSITISSANAVRFHAGLREQQYELTGTVLNPDNGSIQFKTLTANTTFTESFDNGNFITLMIDDGSGYTITWPTISWVGGSAPTLETTGYNIIELWQQGGTLYGAFVGAA